VKKLRCHRHVYRPGHRDRFAHIDGLQVGQFVEVLFDEFGNAAGSNTAADHKAVLADALAQLPWRPGYRVGRKVLVRADTAGGTHEFVHHLHARRLSYSVGSFLSDAAAAALDLIPEAAWTPAYNADGQVRDGAWGRRGHRRARPVRLAAGHAGDRAERTDPGAQLRLTDRDGLRLTAFATNTGRGQLPDLELRHRRRARCEDRIRNAKDTGLANLPLHDFDQNRIWCALVQLAMELTAWLQILALHGHDARRWEPKRLRLRLFSIAGRIARHARRTRLLLAAHAPWAALLTTALTRLQPD
jgi:hypothetical protein